MRIRERIDPRLRDRIDPDVERRLGAIDDALAGREVDPELAELAELARELRAARPEAEAGFAAELDRRAAEGFPPTEGQRQERIEARVRRGRLWRRRLLPAFAGLATVALIGTVVVEETRDPAGGLGDAAGLREGVESAEPDRLGPQSLGRPAPDAAAEGGGRAAQPAIEPGIAPVPPPGRGPSFAPGEEQRRVERTASLTLSTDEGRVREVADGVTEVTDRHQGIVLSSNVATDDEGRSRATFDLRIPTNRLPEALADLSALAHVQSRSDGALDVTAPFVSASERLEDAEAEVASLLDQLAAATSPSEAEAIRERLERARGEAATARARVRELNQRTSFSRVDVAIVSEGDGPWTPGDAWSTALDVLRFAAAVALIAAAILVPLGILALLGWLGWRRLARARRERALDS